MSDEAHIVKSYEEELQNLNDSLIKMGSLTESQLADSMEAIIKVDKESADKIIANDAKINELRAKIDNQIMTVLVKRAPMAIDLRITISTLKISHDLERIGDLAKSVAKKIKPLPHDLPKELIGSLRRLGDLVQKQLRNVLDAYLNKSKESAITIWKNDEQVDDLTNTAMNEVADFLGKSKKNLELATHLLFVTKNIERAGDHITNIAESLYYLIEGEYLEGARPKGKDIEKNS
ncbi:phosphate signaling complex protein PhoU [Pelagibacteraceae bacterium]|nr:phosphate signaling complex protein PhoU [Pelagibacteraceae bacterium]MDC0248116.1 phosphate signaling complex protein PhoU [Pelagibacteraceae bacterium]|tara:strand:- start:536 stop:1237 length:702 start_codon:yes stop_codon:yes gene_type:complete